MMKEKKVVKLRKKNIMKDVILIPIILLFTLIIILAFSPLFNITEIQIEGNFRLTENTIINASNIKIGQNILRIDKNKIKDNIKEIPYIDEVSIKRNWPDKLCISITEKQALAKIDVFGSVIVLDENGIVLESVSDATNLDIPLIENFEITNYGVNKNISLEENNKINNILEVLKILKKNDMLNIVSKISQDTDIIINTKDGHIVNVGQINDLEYKAKTLKALLEKEKEEKYYFDVSNINVYAVSKPLWTLKEEKHEIEVVE